MLSLWFFFLKGYRFLLFDKKSLLDFVCILFEMFMCVLSCLIKKFGVLFMNFEGFVCLRNKYNYIMVS